MKNLCLRVAVPFQTGSSHFPEGASYLLNARPRGRNQPIYNHAITFDAVKSAEQMAAEEKGGSDAKSSGGGAPPTSIGGLVGAGYLTAMAEQGVVPKSAVEAIRARAGTLCGIFFTGYALARMTGEVFREPDPHLGFIVGGITMGQLLSLPMLIAGLALLLWPRKQSR